MACLTSLSLSLSGTVASALADEKAADHGREEAIPRHDAYFYPSSSFSFRPTGWLVWTSQHFKGRRRLRISVCYWNWNVHDTQDKKGAALVRGWCLRCVRCGVTNTLPWPSEARHLHTPFLPYHLHLASRYSVRSRAPVAAKITQRDDPPELCHVAVPTNRPLMQKVRLILPHPGAR